MKNTFFRFCLFVCISLFSVACSNHVKLSGNEFLIEGNIIGVEDGAVINLSRIDGDVGSRIAKDTLKEGRFSFKIEAVSDLERMSIMPIGEGFPLMPLDVWAVPGAKIKIKGKGQLHPTWEVKSSVPYQKEENRYKDNSRDIIAEIARIAVQRDAARARRDAASGDDALAERKIIDSLLALSDSLSIKKSFSDIALMEKNRISHIWLDKMRRLAAILKYADIDAKYADDLRKKAEALYGRMSEEDKNTSMGQNITAYLFPPKVVEVGDDMADGDFFDTNGNTAHLSDYLGKYLLLDFWSIGCGPCIAAIPEMKEISETYRDKLTIISISLDTDAGWKEALAEHNMSWVNVRDPKGSAGLAANYGVYGIPNYIMISPNGKIIDKWSGFGEGYLKSKVSGNFK